MNKRAENNDWTDALKESLQDYEVAPSEGGWERLEAASAARRGREGRGAAAWWPWAAGLAAAVAALGIFLALPEPESGVRTAEVTTVERPETGGAGETETAVDAPVGNSEKEEFSEPGAGGIEFTEDSRTTGLVEKTGPTGSAGEAGAYKQTSEAGKTESAGSNGDSSSTGPDGKAVIIGGNERTKTTSEVGETGETDGAETTGKNGNAEVSGGTGKVGETEGSGDTGTAGSDLKTEDPGTTGNSSDSDDKLIPEPVFRDPFFESKPVQRKRRRPSVGISVGRGLLASASPAVNSYGSSYSAGPKKSARRYDIGELLTHQPPSSIGLEVTVPIGNRFHLETGLDFISLHSSFESISQDLEFTGIPLRIGYKVLDWGFGDLCVNAGGMMEECSRARLMDTDYKEDTQWSASAGAVARCRIAGPVRIFAAPQFSCYFTGTNLPTYRSRQPVSFYVSAGLSFDF